LSCVGSGLAKGCFSVPGVPPTVYKIHIFKINSEWGQVKAVKREKVKLPVKGARETLPLYLCTHLKCFRYDL
jgi:hypothetical protein